MAITWVAIAESANEAATLVPEGHVVVSVEVQAPCAPEPARVIGWMGPPSRPSQ